MNLINKNDIEEIKNYQIEFINILELINDETTKIIKIIGNDKIIINESYEILNKLSSNLQFNSKYIIFKPVYIIELNEKIKDNLLEINKNINDTNLKYHNEELIKKYQNNKIKPIEIKIMKRGFDGAYIKNMIENIMINMSIIYVKLSQKIDINKKYVDIKKDTMIGCYLFFKEQYEKFIELNEMFI
jgi:hypothetical protein